MKFEVEVEVADEIICVKLCEYDGTVGWNLAYHIDFAVAGSTTMQNNISQAD